MRHRKLKREKMIMYSRGLWPGHVVRPYTHSKTLFIISLFYILIHYLTLFWRLFIAIIKSGFDPVWPVGTCRCCIFWMRFPVHGRAATQRQVMYGSVCMQVNTSVRFVWQPGKLCPAQPIPSAGITSGRQRTTPHPQHLPRQESLRWGQTANPK